jgi:hypothetical protein
LVSRTCLALYARALIQVIVSFEHTIAQEKSERHNFATVTKNLLATVWQTKVCWLQSSNIWEDSGRFAEPGD